MSRTGSQFAAILLLAAFAAGQNARGQTIVLQRVEVVRDDAGVQLKFITSLPVKPSVARLTSPDRLVVSLPNTVPGPELKRVEVNDRGVRDVTVTATESPSESTQVVLQLDQALPYTISSDGNQLLLALQGSSATPRTRTMPASAGSNSLGRIFRRRNQRQSSQSTQSVQRPADMPPSTGVSSAGTAKPATSSRPTAAHPSFGSLQEGVVSPGQGEPSTGEVPKPMEMPPSFDPGLGAAARQARAARAQSTQTSGAQSASETPPSTQTAPPASATAEEITPTMQPPVAVSNQASPGEPSSRAMPSVSQTEPLTVSAGLMLQPRTPDRPVAAPQISSVVAESPIPVLPPAVVQVPESVIPVLAPLAPVPQAAEVAKATDVESMRSVPQPSAESAAPAQANEVPQANPAETTAVDSGAGQQLPAPPTAPSDLRTVFKVKYVAQGVAYLDGGRSSGLQESMNLQVKDSDLPVRQGDAVEANDPRIVADLVIRGVADTSAVADIRDPKRPVKPGDLAYLSSGTVQAMVEQRTLSATRKYPVVIAFSEGDPLDEEVRQEIPRPPPPSVNRARGRIGFDYLGTISRGGSTATTGNFGLVMRADITRIGGTYWNLGGYWRGRLDSRSSGQQTLQELINRTYHLNLTYDNPNSQWVAGFGRLYLPWAASLDTIDGGYVGRRIAQGVTAGAFGGSTPDPTSWNYDPQQRIGGTFVNFQGGSFDDLRYTSTEGMAANLLGWQVNRPFVFSENALYYKRFLSIYHSMQADSPRGNATTAAPGPGLGRSFLTVRLQPHARVELDFNHNYLRGLPTFDPQLIGAGLLDKYLFQGFSAGVRVEVVKQLFVYTNLGRSNRTGDAKNSLNQLYGITLGRVPLLDLRADVHYSRFNSSFGDGSYRSLSFSRTLQERFRLEVLAGDQKFSSLASGTNHSRFVNLNLESSFGAHYFSQAAFTISRGQLQSYDQWMFTLGYRFDSKSRHTR